MPGHGAAFRGTAPPYDDVGICRPAQMQIMVVTAKDAPVSRPVQRNGVISSRAILGGLHHRYARV
jgi:hypothetical protein